jgi:multicomponent Na+:H+ antiporter subunit G
MSEAIVALLILAGGGFGVIGGLGLLRMPDVLIRMHAATKMGTLATGLIVAATALHFGTPAEVVRAVLIVLFLLLTAPIASHMIGRAAVSTGVPLWRGEGRDPQPAKPAEGRSAGAEDPGAEAREEAGR